MKHGLKFNCGGNQRKLLTVTKPREMASECESLEIPRVGDNSMSIPSSAQMTPNSIRVWIISWRRAWSSFLRSWTEIALISFVVLKELLKYSSSTLWLRLETVSPWDEKSSNNRGQKVKCKQISNFTSFFLLEGKSFEVKIAVEMKI